MGYETKTYPVSDEIWKLYQQLKKYPDDVLVTTDDFIKEPMDFKVKIYSEFGGEIELDLSQKKDKIGLIYNMLSMIYGTEGSRNKITDIFIELDDEFKKMPIGEKIEMIEIELEEIENKGYTATKFIKKGLEYLEEELQVKNFHNWWSGDEREK
jgi:hypothetical protein